MNKKIPQDVDAKDMADNPNVMRCCDNCIWSEVFIPRPDEPSNIGCKKLNWEGYTSHEKMSCGGQFFDAKKI